jgi:hypothetical protein
VTPAEREQLIRAAVERMLRRNGRARALTKAVRTAQAALHRAIDDEAWRLYLAIEARVNARHDAIVSAAIRFSSRRASPRFDE